MKAVRLQKYIADCGITSRRKAENLIENGLVEVNGVIVTELGTKVNPDQDVVIVEGKIADHAGVNHLYLVMNKPRGCVTTLNDPEGRATVMDFCKEISERIYPVGRLDYLSEGLLILTNDGSFANEVIHPSSNIEKVYEVKIFGVVNQAILKDLRAGVQTPVGFLKPKSVRIIKQLQNKTWLEFRLSEGKNREIRRICEANNLSIDKLKRVAIGSLSIEGIAPGNYQFYSKKQLQNMIGLNRKTESEEATYFSPKRSKTIKDKKIKGKSLANDENYVKFRKEHYYRTLESIKRINREKALKKRSEQSN